jgi:hypothetical protein
MTSANTQKFTLEIPCKGVVDSVYKVNDFGNAASTAASAPSDVTVTVLSDTYTSIKGTQTTNAYDIPAGGEKTLGKFEINYANDKGYGSPDGKLCIVFYANKTLVKGVKMSGTGVEDVACKPSGSTDVFEHVGDASQVEVFDFEIAPFEDNKAVSYTISVEYESSQDGTTAGTDDIVWKVFDQQWFYNGDSGIMQLGYQDEDNVLIGAPSWGENITVQ